MNQEKIGKFIAECRKKNNLTQEKLAEQLGISDRAVSKWERGLNLPDASLMLELSKIFDISVNELLNGEIIEKNNYMEKAEEKLLELQERNNDFTKRLLFLEYIIGFGSSIIFITLIFIASFVELDYWIKGILIVIGCIIFIFGICNSLKIEQVAGYYECSNCHHKYIPTYKSVLFSQHINRTRKMKCPNCHKKNWHKKVISK